MGPFTTLSRKVRKQEKKWPDKKENNEPGNQFRHKFKRPATIGEKSETAQQPKDVERRETKVKQLEDEKAGLIVETKSWKAENNQLREELRMLREAQDQKRDKNDYVDTYHMDQSFDDVLQLTNEDLTSALLVF